MYSKLIGTLFVLSTLFASQSSATFSKIFGGKEDDIANSVVQTDQGYLIAGQSKSFSSNRDFDAYLIHIDKSGEKLWSKVYGGKDDDIANDIVKFGDRYIFVGSTESYGNERLSYFMTKIDSNGEIDWQKSYYRDEDDKYSANAIATDGKRAVIAGTEEHLSFMSSKINPLLVEIDENATRGWRGYYGGKDEDYAKAIIWADNGYLMAGKTETYGHGDEDAYLVKVNSLGAKEWFHAYGGKDDDEAHDIIATEDGYILVGSTESFGLNRKSVFVVKIDKKGKVVWQRTYGGNHDDEGYAITQSPDGGFVIVGKSESFSRSNGYDLYLFKIDAKGTLQWEQTYGGESDDAGYDIITTKDGYLIVGEQKTRISRDSEVWILKVQFNGKL